MSGARPTKAAQFVVKISKYCNLRCTYCYEYHELGRKQRMSLDHIRRFFDNVAVHAAANDFHSVSFLWHGGEPFLVPLDYYEEFVAYNRRSSVIGSITGTRFKPTSPC